MHLQSCNDSSEERKRTILLVEDESFVREATCSILERAGFEVLSAEDAQEALEAYEGGGRTVDLLMTDMVLPGKSGDELGREMRRQSPGVAVLLTSGYAGAEQAAESPEDRTYFLAKPYSRRALVEKIEAILSHRKTQAAHVG